MKNQIYKSYDLVDMYCAFIPWMNVQLKMNVIKK